MEDEVFELIGEWMPALVMAAPILTLIIWICIQQDTLPQAAQPFCQQLAFGTICVTTKHTEGNLIVQVLHCRSLAGFTLSYFSWHVRTWNKELSNITDRCVISGWKLLFYYRSNLYRFKMHRKNFEKYFAKRLFPI